MKKFSLKKITAAVSAAAMIATMGTTAFAADSTPGTITLGEISVIQDENDSTLYNVTVNYEISQDQNNGSTMLTYVKHGADLTTSDTYTDVADANNKKMNIVGVDQKDHKNDKTPFTFKVTTDPDAPNAIYMVPGEVGVLMLSGDNVSSAVASLIAIADLKLNSTELGEIKIPNGANASVAAKKAAILEKVGSAVYTSVYGVKTNVELTADNVTIDDNGSIKVTSNNITKNVTATFAEDDFNVTGITLLTDGDIEYTKDSSENGMTSEDAQTLVAGKIKKVRVVGDAKYGETPTETWSVGNDPATNASIAVTGDVQDDTEKDLTVTVTAPTSAKGKLTASNNTATVKFELTSDPTKVATSYKLLDKNGNDVTSTGVKLTKSATLQAPSASDYTIKLYNNQNEEIDANVWEIKSFTWEPEFNGNKAGTYVGTATIGAKDGSTSTAIGVDDLTVKLTVVVEDAAAFRFGDVNNDGRITATDANEIITYIVRKGEHQFKDSKNKPDGVVDPKFADVTGDFKKGAVKITASDANDIITYIVTKGDYNTYKFKAEQ